MLKNAELSACEQRYGIYGSGHFINYGKILIKQDKQFSIGSFPNW